MSVANWVIRLIKTELGTTTKNRLGIKAWVSTEMKVMQIFGPLFAAVMKEETFIDRGGGLLRSTEINISSNNTLESLVY